MVILHKKIVSKLCKLGTKQNTARCGHRAHDSGLLKCKDTPPKWGISAERERSEEEISLKFFALGGGFAHSIPQGALSVSSQFSRFKLAKESVTVVKVNIFPIF